MAGPRRKTIPQYCKYLDDMHLNHLYGERAAWALCMGVSERYKTHMYAYYHHLVQRRIAKREFILKLTGEPNSKTKQT